MQQSTRIISLAFMLFVSIFSSQKTFAQTETLNTGSFIIDMGAQTPTVANTLKPFGLIYDLLKNYNVPVKRVINSSKTKDGIDFTHNGKNFRGGPFIIPAEYRNSTINQVVRNWQLQGVIIDSLVSNASLDVSFTIKSAPRWAIDSINKTIAISFLTAAGIPASAYSVKSAEQLNTCDDIYIMPHNDGVNWIKHRNLYFWNKNQKGSIWAGCLAASILENVYKDTTAGLESPGQTSGRISMNFLTNNGLVLWSNHNETPVLPFTNINTGDVMAQYIGIPDSAQLSGRETVYLPKLGGGWNSKSIVITYQPKQPDIPTLSAGVAAENVYGRAYGDSTRGFVMYQSSHDFGTSHNGDKKNGGNQGSGSWNNSLSTSQIVNNTAAQCIFFNFSFYSSVDKLRTILTASISGTPTQMTAGTLYSGFTATTGGSASGITYSWKSSLPGTFSNPTGQTTSFTPSAVTKSSICAITCSVTDNCGRSVFDSKGGIIIVPGGVPFNANAISKSISSSCSSSALSFNVFDNNIDSNAGARTLTAVSGFSHGSVSFSSSGVVNYTANANYNGPDNATYTINNGTSSASASITISVGSIALFPTTVNDSASVLEDSVTVISVLANDKNNPSALNGNQLFIRDIISKPTKGYVYINSNGTVSYLSKKDASSGSGSDNFTYQTCNSSGFCSIGTVYITIIKDACSAGQYQAGLNVVGYSKKDTLYPTADTYIDSSSSGKNYGSSATFRQDNRTGSSSQNRHALLKFNLSSYASTLTIDSAVLRLTLSAGPKNSITASANIYPLIVYPLRVSWIEGTGSSGGTTSSTSATWTTTGTAGWSTLGAKSSVFDYYATPFAKSASTPTKVSTSGDSLKILMTTIVQNWINNTITNNGFELFSTNTSSGNSQTYNSKEATGLNRPMLIIKYTTPTLSFPCNTIPTTYNPIGYPDTSSTPSNTAKTINVLTNDTNYYGNTNSVFAVSTPVHGTTSIVSGNVLYTPSGSYVGIDTFYYTLKDGTNNQTTLVSVRVNVKRVAPLVNSDSAYTNSGTAVTVSIGLNDSDPQGTLSSPSITVNPKFGSAVVSGNSIIYTPSAGFTGKDSLIYSRTGSVSSSCETALTDTAIVRIRIINQSPIALNDTGNTVTCVPVNVNLTQNDIDAEGTPLTVYLLTSPSHGTLTFKQTGIYTFTPATNFNGTDLFTYKIKDGSPDSLSSNTATVYFNVLGTPAPNNHPVAINDSNLTYINQDLQLDVLANDYDPDGFNLTVNISASGLLAPTHGTLHLENNGMITYTPNVNFIGTDSYQYQICDQHTNCSGTTALCATAIVFVRVIANPISTSGTIWDDENNSAHTTFNTIYTVGEPGTNAGSSLYTFIVDSNNIVIDNSFVDHDGSYMMVNTPPVTSTLKLWLSSDYKNIGDNLTTSQLPYSWSYTTPANYNYHSGANDTTGYDFGINQFPSPTPYSFPLTLNPVSTIIIDSSKVLGTDGGVGYVVNIHYMYFPTNTTSFTINGTTYTSGTWPSSGVSVPKYTPIRILPNSGSVTPVITFKVVDNGGAESRDSNFVSIPLYKILAAGTIGGGGNTFCGSGTPSAMTSVANADGGRAAIQYQWQSSTVSNFSSLVTDITGAISSTYSPSSTVSVTTYFRRKVYTTIDTAVYSNILTITVNQLPALATSRNSFSRAGTGTVPITATPPSGCVIDWYANSSGGSALKSGSSATDTIYTTPSISFTTIYYAFARNTTTGCISAGTPVTATVTGTINPGVIGNDQSLCGSNVPDSIKNVTVSSGVSGFTYTWQSSAYANFSTLIPLNGDTTTADYVPIDAIDSTTYFRRQTSKSGSTTTYSNSVVITINALPNTPSVTTGIATTLSGSLTLTATPGTGETIDWYDADGGNLLLSGSNTYNTPTIYATTIYYAIARNISTGCISANSAPDTATINPSLDGGLIAGNTSFCGSGTPSAFTSTNPATGGTGSITYQWQSSTTSSTSGFTNISGATSLTYTPSLINTTTYFQRKCVTPNDSPAFSNTLTVMINSLPSVVISPSSVSIIIGSGTTLAASGANSYLWNTTATTSSISISPVVTSSYSVIGTDGNGCSDTGYASVTVNPIPSVGGTASATSSTICSGSSASISLTGNTGTIIWQTSSDGSTWADTTVTSSTLSTTVIISGYRYYRAKVTNGTASPAYSNGVIIIATATNIAGSIIGNTTVCSGTNSTSLNLTGNTGGVVKWQSSTVSNFSSSVTDISNTNSTYSASNLTSALYYRVIVKSGVCPADTSTGALMSVNQSISNNIISSNQTICNGVAPSTLTATSPSGGNGSTYSYNWLSSITSATTGFSSASGTNNSGNYSPSALSQNTWYKRVVSSGVCPSDTSTYLSITINTIPTIASTTSDSICGSGTVTLHATASAGTLNWYAASTGGSSLGTGTAFITPTISTSTNYYVDATSSGCTTASRTAVLAKVNTIPIVASTTSDSICGSGTITLHATASAGILNWYAASTGGSSLGTGTAFITPTISTNTNYYVNATINGCTTASRTTVLAKVNSNITASISISASSISVCGSNPITFTATPLNGGTSPSYQWKQNGSNIGTNNAVYISSSPTAGDTVYVILTSNASPCLLNITANSNGIKLTSSTVTPSVSVGASATTICAGTNVTFTATPSNGGTTPAYQWKLNGSNVGTNSTTYSNSGLSNNDTVTVILTSNATCVTTATANGNKIGMTVNTNLTPSVSVGASATTICAGTNVTFTATPTNGGTTPAYQWKLNGSNSGTNSTTYSNAGLSNNDTVTVVLTSNATCVTSATANGNKIGMTVNTNLTPSVSVGASATTICSGTNVTFTATPTNGGTTPAYQWKLNGSNSGTNSTTYSNAGLSNNDTVTVVLTSNATCVTSATANGNKIGMTVNTNLTPSVSVGASATIICAGTNVTFTATPSNGGTTPAYQWKLNGSNVGTNSTTYSNAGLSNNDTVTVVLTSNATCVTTATANGNKIGMTVNTNLTPSVSVGASATTICAGTNVTFTATPTNGGTTPSYQWKLNGSNAGTNSTTYSNAGLSNNDTVTVILTSNATCVTSATANGNKIGMTVNTNLTPSVSVGASATTICSSTNVTFTATPANGGTTPAYQWKLNGSNVGTNSTTYSNSGLSNHDTITVVITSNATCLTTATANGNKIGMTVNTVPTISTQPVTLTQCQSTSATFSVSASGAGTISYIWRKNGTAISGATNYSYSISSIALSDSGNFTVDVINGCGTTYSNTVRLNINPTLVSSVSLSSSSSSVCGGAAITFTANATNGGITPHFQWKRNGVNAGTDSINYLLNSPNLGDSIYVILTSNASPCLQNITANSNGIKLTNSTVTPTVSISTTNTTICASSLTRFAATGNNTGSTPHFQWKINSTNAGTDSAIFNTTSLNTNDTVKVVMTSSASCTSTSIAISNNLVMLVNTVPGIINQPISGNAISGNKMVFTLRASNAIIYQWQQSTNGGSTFSNLINNSIFTGTSSDTLTINNTTGLNNNKYRVYMTNSCGGAYSDSVLLHLNLRPSAKNDTILIGMHSTNVINIMLNDSDFDGVLNNPVITKNPLHGTASIDSTGKLIYQADSNSFGYDTIMYRICDNGTPVACDSAYLVIYINGAPHAVNDSINVFEDDYVTFNPRINDVDPDGTINNPVIISTSNHGTAIVNSNGSITYTPVANYNGFDTIYYRICDNGNPVACDSAYIFLNVISVNDAPIALNDTVSTIEDSATTFNPLSNDVDIDGTLNNPSIISSPNHGTVVVNSNGSITYTPNPNYNGNDTIFYRVCDNGTPVKCDSAHIYIHILSVNNAPVAINDTINTNEDIATTFAPLSNDFDIDGTLNNPAIIISSKHGNAIVNSNGTITYTPVLNFNGYDTIYYRVCDNGFPVLCDSAFIYIKVISINDAPIALNDTVATNENTATTFNPRLNDSDIDGLLNNPSIITSSKHGTSIVNIDGTITYTPTLNYNGYDTIFYRVCDNGTPSLCDSAFIFISVKNVNHAPVAGNTSYYILNNLILNGTVKNLVTDQDNNIDTISFVITTSPSKGILTMQPNGNFNYTPQFNFVGRVSFVYRVCDKGILCDTGLVEFVLAPANKAPLVLNDSFEVVENHELTFDVRINDKDTDGILGTPSIILQPSNGTITVNGDGTLLYIPHTNFTGTDLFKYSICDNGIPQLCDSATVKITVTKSLSDVVSIPQGFSPNNDGYNDLFVITNIDKYPNNKLTVVNRWGETVYEKQFYRNDWNGNANKGILTIEGVLPSGTYFYIFETGTSDPAMTGYIYITR